VLTRDKAFEREDVIVCNSVDELLNKTKKYSDDELFVIGGEKIYELLLPYCDTAYVTKVFADGQADKYMVNLDKSVDWEIESETEDFKSDGLTYRFDVYKRI
jgi:dihydrofolate reductase